MGSRTHRSVRARIGRPAGLVAFGGVWRLVSWTGLRLGARHKPNARVAAGLVCRIVAKWEDDLEIHQCLVSALAGGPRWRDRRAARGAARAGQRGAVRPRERTQSRKGGNRACEASNPESTHCTLKTEAVPRRRKSASCRCRQGATWCVARHFPPGQPWRVSWLPARLPPNTPCSTLRRATLAQDTLLSPARSVMFAMHSPSSLGIPSYQVTYQDKPIPRLS